MNISPQALMMLFQTLRSAPTVVKGLQGAIDNANANPTNSFSQQLAGNAISATQEAISRGYDLGLLENSAQRGFDNLPMDIMPDPMVGGGQGAVVDSHGNPIYTSVGSGHVFPFGGESQEFSPEDDIVKKLLYAKLTGGINDGWYTDNRL